MGANSIILEESVSVSPVFAVIFEATTISPAEADVTSVCFLPQRVQSLPIFSGLPVTAFTVSLFDLSTPDITLINDIFGTENWGNCQFLLNISPVGYPADPLGQLQKQTDENVVIDRNRNIIKLIMRKPTVQSALFAGCVMPKLEPEERAYLALANMMFGGFFGSRLMTNIREDKGYTYGIHSSLQQQLFFNLFSIQTETANLFVNKVVEEVNNEINRII